jgi:hypothetical protein
LRHAKIGRVEDIAHDLKAEMRSGLTEGRILRGPKQLWNVLHQKDIGFGLLECTQVLTPEGPPLQPYAAHVQRRKTLAGRTADDDIGRGEGLDPFYRTTGEVIAEIGPIRLRGILVALDGENRAELAAVKKAAGETSAASEQIYEREATHDARRR